MCFHSMWELPNILSYNAWKVCLDIIYYFWITTRNKVCKIVLTHAAHSHFLVEFQWSCLLLIQSIASCSGSVIQVPCLVCSECCRMNFISVIPSCSETVASCSGSLIIVSCLVCSECHKTCFYFSDSDSLWDILLFLLEFSTFSARLCLLGMQ